MSFIGKGIKGAVKSCLSGDYDDFWDELSKSDDETDEDDDNNALIAIILILAAAAKQGAKELTNKFFK